MAEPSPSNASTTKRRFAMTPRRWAALSAICFLAAAYYVCYEHFPVHVTKDTPLYRATRNGKQGIVTAGGRVAIPFEWDDIRSFDDEGRGYVVVNQEVFGEVFGVIDVNGKVIIPATLTDASWGFDDHDEFQGVRDQQLINFDRSGKEKWRTDWLPVSVCEFGKSNLMAVQKGKETGWIDRTGRIRLKPPVGLLAASNFLDFGLALVRNEEGLEGCINEQGTIVIPAEWTDISFVTHTLDNEGNRILANPMFVRVSIWATNSFHDQVHGLYSLSGQCIVPAKYFGANIHFEMKWFHGRHLDGTYRAFDFQGKQISLPSGLEDLDPVEGSDLFVAKRDGKYGFLDRYGRTAISFDYDAVQRHVDDRLFQFTAFGKSRFAAVGKKGRWGVIDREGRVVVPFDYDQVSPSLIQHDLFVATKNRQHGCLNAVGETVIPFEFIILGKIATDEYFIGSKKGEDIIFDGKGIKRNVVKEFKLQSLGTTANITRWGRSSEGVWLNWSPNHLAEWDRYRKLFFEAHDEKTDGRGVFHATRGVVVPPVHKWVAFTGNGFFAVGLQYADSPFVRYARLSMVKLSEWVPQLLPAPEKTQVLYDINGNVIWRNDARLFDFLKAFGLSCWGLYCFRKYRIAKREQKMQAA